MYQVFKKLKQKYTENCASDFQLKYGRKHIMEIKNSNQYTCYAQFVLLKYCIKNYVAYSHCILFVIYKLGTKKYQEKTYPKVVFEC